MKKSGKIALVLALVFSQAVVTGQQQPNLFPNGDVEHVYVNQITYDSDFRTRMKGGETEMPAYWQLSMGATLSRNEKFSGKNAIRLSRGEEEVTARVYSNHWRVKDGNMPFGLPLVQQTPVTVSFRYKTSGLRGNEMFHALIRLGVIADLDSQVVRMDLPASKEWKLVTREITLNDLKWGGEIIFSLPGKAKKGADVWIDDVYLSQPLKGVNLVKNHSFEKETTEGTLPPDWQVPVEDQWVGWVGERYRKPVIETGESVGGNRSMRADVTYGDCSGAAQRIVLNQHQVKPVVIEIWSKLSNSISSKAYNSYADNYANLTLYVYHQDGTMQEVSPTCLLGATDHDWDMRRFGFRPQKPVKEILLQITVLGTEQTTSLWVDEIRAYEPGTDSKELEARGTDFPTPSLSAKWGKPELPAGPGIEVYNDSENIYVTVPQQQMGGEISIYFNPRIKSTSMNHFRYLFKVVKIGSDGRVYRGTTFEKQGYTEDGAFEPAETNNITSEKTGTTYMLTIPFKSLKMSGASLDPVGFNVRWKDEGREHYWSGKTASNHEMGRIILAKKPGLRIQKVIFGRRYFDEQDQSQDFISHPQLYAGSNQVEVTLTNDGPSGEAGLVVGIQGIAQAEQQFQLGHSRSRTVTLPYQAGLGRMTEFTLTATLNEEVQISRTYPLQVPAAIEIVLDQEYYYAEEDTAFLEIYNRYRPFPEGGAVNIEIMDMRDQTRVQSFTRPLTDKKVLVPVDIREYRVNPLPVQDYSVSVIYHDGQGNELGKDIRYFGRINHTERRKLPPIESVNVDDKGRIVINGNFRFFPIVPSVKKQKWDESNDMGANMIRSHLGEGFTPFRDRDRAWEKNVYTMTIGPYRLKDVPLFEEQADSLIEHPGFLMLYAKQFYYWHLTPEWIAVRKKVEHIVGNLPSPRLVIWGHHDGSYIYDHTMPAWPISDPPVGYCYVKVMSRPSSAWRNTPFMTKTEQVLNPSRFKLAEVNYYVTAHVDEVVPEYSPGILSLHADDWHGVRNESYLNIIYGATGLYHWVWAQEGQVQRLRGWFQELNYMWPVFVADDAENGVEILPADSQLDARLKQWQGNYYLLVANRGETLQHASIYIDGFEGMKVEKLFELPGDISVKEHIIQDVWKKYDVHVYKIEPEKQQQ